MSHNCLFGLRRKIDMRIRSELGCVERGSGVVEESKRPVVGERDTCQLWRRLESGFFVLNSLSCSIGFVRFQSGLFVFKILQSGSAWWGCQWKRCLHEVSAANYPLFQKSRHPPPPTSRKRNQTQRVPMSSKPSSSLRGSRGGKTRPGRCIAVVPLSAL